MNGTVNRRVFVGSVAAGLPVVVGVGVAAWPFTDLNGQGVTSARHQDGSVVAEVHRQLKDALAKMQNGASEGARQAATVMRVYASTVNDGQLRAVLAKANRQTLLYADADNEMMLRHVDRLGLRREIFPPHSIRRGPDREAAVNRLLTDCTR